MLHYDRIKSTSNLLAKLHVLSFCGRGIMRNERRQFLATSVFLGVTGIIPSTNQVRGNDKTKEGKSDAEDVTATEDLMREHGVLNRILLIYEEGLRRLRAKEEVTPDVFQKPATLVRKFVEDYHEKLEEKFIFPEFEKAKKLVDLVKVLREQHEAGRKATDVVLRSAVADRFNNEDARKEVVRSCEVFIRMYRPHEAREDTVLFPALHKLISAKQIKELGEQFEKEEDRLFGEEGFEKTVEQVAVIEKQVGIYDLSKFTAK
jgi:hemerythrin-like domain-containing protein